jgi:hypothetical protein
MCICEMGSGSSINLNPNTSVCVFGLDYVTDFPTSFQKMIKSLLTIMSKLGTITRVYSIKCPHPSVRTQIKSAFSCSSFSTMYCTPEVTRTMNLSFHDFVTSYQLLQMSRKRCGVYSSPSEEVFKIQPRPEPWNVFHKCTVELFHYPGVVFNLMWRHPRWSGCVPIRCIYNYYPRTNCRCVI